MDDNIANSLAELDAVIAYGKRYKHKDFVFEEVEKRLIRAIRYLAVEIESLRDETLQVRP